MDALFDTTSLPLPAPWSAVAFAAALLTVAGAVMAARAGRMKKWGSVIWVAAFVAADIALGVACLASFVVAPVGAWCSANVALFCAGLAATAREACMSRPVLRDAAALCLAAPLVFLGMEVACNEHILSMYNTYAFVEVCLILLALSALYFIAQRHGWLAALAGVALVVFGAAESYVLAFKGSAIMPSDLLAARTAAAVAGGYDYSLGANHLFALACAALAAGALSLPLPSALAVHAPAHAASTNPARTAPAHDAPSPKRGRRVTVNTACGLALAAVLALVTVPADYQDAFGFKLYYWQLHKSYERYGLLVGFVAAAQDLPVDTPAGYSADAAQAATERLLEAYEKDADGPAQRAANDQFDTLRPNVVVVMCESYADLSVFEELHAGYTGTWTSTQPDDALLHGMTTVSVHGGGTCNSEFELLTGLSMAYFGQGKYPFLQYSFDRVNTLASPLAELGYASTFIHPASSANWDRNVVYDALGFDRTMFFSDFASVLRFHHYTSDESTYSAILDVLSASDAPQFVFDVTLQNHSGYGLESIPADDRTDYVPANATDDMDIDKLNEYLSCIAESDRAIEEFLERLRAFDEPVVVLFFGDHQPSLSRVYNDAYFEGEDELDHAARIMETPYFLWANYDVSGREQDGSAERDVSLNYLGAVAFETVGAPFADYQKASLALAREMPAVNVNGYLDSDGAWHAFEDGFSNAGPCNELAIMQYARFEDELH